MNRLQHLAFFFTLVAPLTHGVTVSDLRCHNGETTALRIPSCEEQPCTIKKGEEVPFELDFSFKEPSSVPSKMVYNALNPYYAVPPAAYGSFLAGQGNCDNGGLGFECPLHAGKQYTIKSHMYIDPKAVCTAGCDNLSEDGTGLRQTHWDWNVFASETNGSSFCTFRLTINITN